ncbi:MAG TPA: carbohydrate ABC transporter permease [Chloroflexota bacterium]|nr:carbohydrate ABC transporter permease [Chloroflexota bacterium]
MARTNPIAASLSTATTTREGVGGVARALRLLQVSAFHTLLAVVAFIALFPIVWLLVGSLQTIQELYRGVTFWPALPQFQNYYIAWTKGGFSVYLPNSLFYSTVSVLAILLAASMAGYALARIEFPGRGAVMFLIMAIIIVPLPATFIALYKLLVDIGLANTRTGYILAMVAAGLPIAIFILRGFFMRQPKELEDAAILDGCSAFDVYWRVMLPLARPGLAAVAVIEFLRLWNEYLLALVTFNSETLMPVQRGLTKFVSSDTPEQHILLAATAMAVLPVLILYTVAQKSIIQGIMEGAVKA